MDKYEPTIIDLIDEEYYYFYKQYLDEEITWQDWIEIKETIWKIKDLLKTLKR